ncbi:hypothetical protein D9757_006746 [Collybiopsis confluens]|uniref:Uncharacterized protein n=1 Tax=Collybiopsis confluens TaxID=2823264 RepID=A0A8H5M9L0_9AGAR|nr:hypothetical protein D9757_006746 [Collybiopsis confluens]
MSTHIPGGSRPDESSSTIFSEHTWLQGAFLGAIAYGIEFVLYSMACQMLWVHRRRYSPSPRRNIFLICYISVIFILSTLYLVGLLEFTQLSFIDGRNIEGGPNNFEEVMFSLPIDMLANVIMVLNAWLCDIINVWRCFVIYQGCTIPAIIVNAVPMLLYLASIAFGILFLKQVGTPAQSPWLASGINFTIPYYAMSLALNILVTCLIVTRLLFHRHRITRAIGSGHGSQYTSLVAIIIESAAIYSAFALAFLIPFGLNSPVAQLFLQALSLIQGLTTFLIIFRIAQGKGYSEEAITNSNLFKDSENSGANRTFGGHNIQFRRSARSTSEMGGNSIAGTDDSILMRKMQALPLPMGGGGGGQVDVESGRGIQISKTILVEETA